MFVERMRPAQSALASSMRGEVDLLYGDLAEVVKSWRSGNEWLPSAQISLSLVSRFFSERQGALERVAKLSIDIVGRGQRSDGAKQRRRGGYGRALIGTRTPERKEFTSLEFNNS